MVSERFQKGPVLGWGGPKIPPLGGWGYWEAGQGITDTQSPNNASGKKFL